MRRARAKPPRIRVVKRKPKQPSGAPNQIYDEDVLRWRRMFTDEEALAAARLAGPGAAGLASCPTFPVLSPEPCSNALQYVNTLTEDGRHAVFKHCALVSRHERMLLEGQERLKYVQAQVREMKARLPPPPLPPRSRNPAEKGPEVTAEPVPQPSCWASCCGLIPLPPLPAPPPPPRGPLVIRLPDESYFREEAAKRDAAARGVVERERASGIAASSGGGASLGPTRVEPVSASVGGATDAPAAPTAAADAVVRHAAGTHSTAAAAAAVAVVGTVAELPGQLDAMAAGTGAAAATAVAAPPPPTAQVAQSPVAAVTPAAAPLPLPSPLPPPPLAPIWGKAPGAPQSLLRPLALVPLTAAAGEQSPKGGLVRVPPLPQFPAVRTPPVADVPDGSPAAAAAASAGSGTAAAAASRQPAQPGGGDAAAAAVDLRRYQDPESIRKITQIQAAQRGRVARQQVAGMRAAQQQQQRAGAAAGAGPVPDFPDGGSGGGGGALLPEPSF